MRVATYARYSSDNQRAASIPDQQRLCHEHARRHGWDIVSDFSDPALSGASLKQRPGVHALLRGASNGDFDIVLTESLDRISRDQEDTAKVFKTLKFARVQLITLAEGVIDIMQVGFKGTMNAMFLQDLAAKTHRGLRGRVEAGKSGGGRCYGYRVVLGEDGERGERQLDHSEASIVRKIFRDFSAGVSPKAIAKALNSAGVPGPRRRRDARPAAWSPSTIHGHAGRGTGILNNELYVGRLVWNRQRFEKNPDTGKRIARLNPPADWITTEVPHLRIIDDELWQAAKARQVKTRATMKAGIVRARRPKYLFSGLTSCETCGGGFSLSSRDTLRCFNATSRGTCTNTRSIRRQEVEARTLRAMRERFFDPGAFAAFCEGFTAELTRLRREHLAQMGDARRDIAAVERRREEILAAVTAGYRSESWKAELLDLDAKQAALTAALAEPPMPALHPRMADVFRQKATALAEGLEFEHDDHRDAAREALRGFVDGIVIPPGDGLLRVTGNFGEMLKAAGGHSGAAAVGYIGCGGRI